MKKSLLSILAMTGVALAMTSCDKQPQQTDAKSAQQAPTELKIAFVEVDSIMTQYTFCKEQSLVLEKKSQNIQNTINAKGQQLQQAAANFQQKLQQNAYTREQAEAIQANLQKQDNDLRALQQRLGNEFAAETEKFNNALRDSIQHYIAQYNKDKKFTLILTKQGDNLLYADKALDITSELVDGLNKAYKPSKKAAAAEKKDEAAAKKETPAKSAAKK